MAKMVCSYCGNNSGKMDSRGLCASCGSRLEIIEDSEQAKKSIYPGTITGSSWCVINGETSGSLWYRSNFSISTPIEIRKMYGVEDD